NCRVIQSGTAGAIGLIIRNSHWGCNFRGTNSAMDAAETPIEVGQWAHVAIVWQNGKICLWVNGHSTSEADPPVQRVTPSDVLAIGGYAEAKNKAFDGEIDEVRLLKLNAPFDPEMLLKKE